MKPLSQYNVFVEKEYCHNRRFRDYVDKYAKKHEISVDEAFTHDIVRSTMKYYTEV